MAHAITRAPEFQSTAERRTFEALVAGLPAGWGVAHGVRWTVLDRDRTQQSSEADIVVVAPAGVCTIEVKGGRITRRGTEWFSTDRHGRTHEIKDPAAQALRSSKTLRDRIRAMWIHAGEFGHAVAFPDGVAGSRELGMDLDGGVVIDGAAFPNICAHIEALLRTQRTRKYFTPAELDRITRLLEPEWKLGGDLGLEVDRMRDKAAELTDQQHRMLKNLAGLSRVVVRGGPGTGKSLLALRCATDMAEQGMQVLYVCYNRPLAEAQARAARDVARLRVSTFHELCEAWATEAAVDLGPRPPRSDRAGTSAWFKRLVDAVVDGVLVPENERYDAIVIDEGQDFRPEWITLLELALADRESGRFHLYLDGTQRIYNTETEPPALDGALEWQLDGQQRTAATLAVSIADFLGDPEPDCGLDGGDELVVVEVPNPEGVADALRKQLHELIHDRGVRQCDIVVQTGVSATRSAVWDRKLGNVFLQGRDSDSWEEPVVAPDEVRIETIHRFKGLETPATILVEIDPSTKADLRTLIRIGLTRAQTYAAIVITPEVRRALEAG